MEKLIKYTVRTSIFFLLLSILLSLYFLSYSPVAFQKCVSLKPVSKQKLLEYTNNEFSASNIDIKSLINKIPYKVSEMVYEVNPELLFRKTIEEGKGNCSNLSFGLSYYLLQNKQSCQIIHFLPIDGFLHGDGHTVINTSYSYDNSVFNGIVDVIEGGFPLNNNIPIGVHDIIEKKDFQHFNILPLNDKKDSVSPYYDEQFLVNSEIGVIPQDQIKEYFTFMSGAYFPIFSNKKKLEKILFNGLSVVFGCYPNIYVTESDYSTLFENHFTTKILAYVLIFSLRIIMLLVLLLTLLYLILLIGMFSKNTSKN